MKRPRIVTLIFIMLILAVTLVKGTASAQVFDEMQTFFSKEYPGISIRLNATRETVPGTNITIALLVNYTASNIKLFNLELNVYGYNHSEYELRKTFLCEPFTITEPTPIFNHTIERNYTIPIPSNVWDLIYVDLSLQYVIAEEPRKYNEVFPITIVMNPLFGELTELREKLQWLNQTYQNLESVLDQLNQTFREYFGKDLTPENFNATCQDLKGSQNELGSTRMAVAVLTITTVFFVATTAYLFLRKPKQVW